MAVWLQDHEGGGATATVAARIGLLLLGHRDAYGLEPLLLPPIPWVDGLLAPRTCSFKRPDFPTTRFRTPPSPRDLAAGRIPGEAAAFDYLLWLRPGESLLAGGKYSLLRETAQLDPGTRLLPVHYPAGEGLTLITLEPRWIATSPGSGFSPGLLDLPLESAGPPESEPPSAGEDQAWVLLYRAVRGILSGERRAGHALLQQLYIHTATRAPGIAGLALRNGLVAALATGDEPLRQWYWQQSRGCRGYAELHLLRALVPLLQGEPGQTVKAVTRLLEEAEPGQNDSWVSGGGELTYRALTFRGMAHARLGDLKAALGDWIAALRINPDYLEPLRLAAGQRFHAAVLDREGFRHYGTGRTATAAALVVRLYAQSTRPEVAAALLNAAPHLPVPKEVRRAAAARCRSPARAGTRGVCWEGALFTASSLARVNRELAARLLAAGWDLGAIPTEPQGYHPPGSEAHRPLAERLWHRPDRLEVTVRHCWPPLLEPAGAGRLVICLPWELGAIPTEYLEGLRAADQVWVYSEWVRQGAIRSGLDPERVAVVPCGFDPAIFRPDNDREDEDPELDARSGDERFHFLYVGGTIPRKGYDLALAAFLAEFGPDEPVRLTIKDFGSDTFYRGVSGRESLRQAEAETAGVRRQVQVIDNLLTDAELAALYRSAHCLVAPYRAEGFCMPALEAMACGTPAILPRFGPALDYARPETALLLDADVFSVGDEVNGLRLAGEGICCQVRPGELPRAMRRAYAHPGEMAAMGRLAAADVHERCTWSHAAQIAGEHLRALCQTTDA
ncbi:MAG TPA: glycosyltransferase [Symbiobacteriaceae bacterium]